MTPTNNIAYTAPINPSGASPVLNRDQIWAGLLLKIRSAETFVPAAILSTTTIRESTDSTTGNLVTEREVVFREGPRKVKETVTAFAPSRVEFKQSDGSTIQNVISEGADGELYMTYIFELRHPGASAEELAAFLEKERKLSKGAVEGSIVAMRKLVEERKI